MKKFVALFALMLSTVAAADSILLLEKRTNRDEEVYRVDFDVNKSLNRAWVEITFAESSHDDLHYSDSRVKVPGLSYDPEINGVVYEKNGEKIVCGTFYNNRWIIDRGMSFRKTGRCTFSNEVVKVDVDNGFEIRTYPYVRVYLNVQ